MKDIAANHLHFSMSRFCNELSSFLTYIGIDYNEEKKILRGTRIDEVGGAHISLAVQRIIGDPAVEVRGLAYHSREVADGFLFAAIRGLQEDGRRFIPEALSRGARSLLVDEPLEGPGVVQVVVPNVREALARFPPLSTEIPLLFLTLVGITGTNGKTTTSYLIEAMLEQARKKGGSHGNGQLSLTQVIFSLPRPPHPNRWTCRGICEPWSMRGSPTPS